MPSHLTRQVFRRLLANEPIVHRGCLRRQCSTLIQSPTALRTPTIRNGRTIAICHQRRHFLNFNMFGKKEEVTEPSLDPGIEKMMELAKRQRMNARMPALEEVSTAVVNFLSAKVEQKQPMTDTQAALVLQSLEYYYSIPVEDSTELGSHEKHDEVARNIWHRGVTTLLRTEKATPAHCELARLWYEGAVAHLGITKATRCLMAYVKMLCMQSSTTSARDIVLQCEREMTAAIGASSMSYGGADATLDVEETEDQDSFAPERIRRCWEQILHGFALEGNTVELNNLIANLDARGLSESAVVTAHMIEYWLNCGDSKMVQHWWQRHHKVIQGHDLDKSQTDARTGHILNTIFRWCISNSELELGHEIVKDVMATNPPKVFWDAIFVWGAGTKKGVDEIGRMMDVMEKTNETIPDSAEWRHADIVTINALVDFAVSQQDPYMAERFIALGRERNIEPDARTYALQMDYRLGVGDVDGALIAYKALADHRNKQITEDEITEDVGTINRLVVALCRTQRHDFDTIMNVTMDLADRKAEFKAETISALTLLHLARDEGDDATDLLNTHAFHLSSADRAIVRNSLINFALDSKTSLSRAWRTYTILRNVFDETDREQRTQLMTSFFARERTDMGVHVFQHMRMHSRADTIPTIDTYVSAFMGLARNHDLESVEVVHNLLKLDFNITITTYLRNALIIAYTACDRGRKAFGFWGDIVRSREGPNYNSIHIALRACERSPFGDLQAKRMWALLRRRNVNLDQALWASYAGALAGNGDNDSAINTIEEAEANGELEVDSFIVGSLFNGAAGQIKQAEIETWAKEKYAPVWAELEGFGVARDENGMRAFKIDRRVSP